MHSLSDSTQGYTYTIKWMFGLPEVMKSMHDMNIHEGSTIRVLPQIPRFSYNFFCKPKDCSWK